MGLPKGRETEGQASRASPPQICFHGAPPAELWGPWGSCSSRMGDTEPPNAHPTRMGSQNWLSPKGTTPGMVPPPCHHPPVGVSTPWGSALPLCAPQDPHGGKAGASASRLGLSIAHLPLPRRERDLWGTSSPGPASGSSFQCRLLPQGGRGEPGPGKKGMYGGNSMGKPTRCQLCQVVQRLKCHRGFLFCFPPPQAGKRGQTPPHTHLCQCSSPPSPSSPAPISSKAKASQVSRQHPRLSQPLPTVRVGERGLRPKGMCWAFGVTAETSRPLRRPPSTGMLRSLPALPSQLLPLSKINPSAFSSFQAAALSGSACFQRVSSSSGTHSQ